VIRWAVVLSVARLVGPYLDSYFWPLVDPYVPKNWNDVRIAAQEIMAVFDIAARAFSW
jgi:hypothetical protein